MSKLQRRLAAIMFTDIVGYSAMMQKDEVIANRKRKRHKEVFNQLTPAYDGQILQYYGDGTLSIFNSTTAAVECAIAIQRALKKEPRVSLRVGLHTGDITLSDEDIFGDGVNIASRIESLCVPGGVFVSGKVYDDIKNHPTIRAQYVGNFDLKNINDKTLVYAISNAGITVPDAPQERINTPKYATTTSKTTTKKSDKKRKKTAGILALLLGIFGAHRFYLGDRGLGITYLTIGGLGIFAGSRFFIMGIAIISFIDAILFFVSSEKDFDAKYNADVVTITTTSSTINTKNTKYNKREDPEVSKRKSLLKAKFERQKETAKAYFKNYEYQNAIDVLDEALEIKYDDKEAHFLLAKGYSMLENAQKALIHLDAAIAFGMDIKKAKYDHALAFLRISPEYKSFMNNGYRILDNRPTNTVVSEEPKEDLLSTTPDLLAQMNKLKELRNRGFLTEEEFVEQKKRLKE